MIAAPTFGDARLPNRLWLRTTPLSNGCWEWAGAVNGTGYGRAWMNGDRYMAHRLFYVALVGPITEQTLDHLCRNRKCVNPAHLEPVSLRENNIRGNTLLAANLQKTHCPQGHSYSGANLYIGPDKSRHCRICHRLDLRSARRRKATAALAGGKP